MPSPAAAGNVMVISALRARANFGKLLDQVQNERGSLVIEKRGTPRAVLLSLQDYVRLAAPEPEILRVIGEGSRRKGTSKLTSRQIDKLINRRERGRNSTHAGVAPRRRYECSGFRGSQTGKSAADRISYRDHETGPPLRFAPDSRGVCGGARPAGTSHSARAPVSSFSIFSGIAVLPFPPYDVLKSRAIPTTTSSSNVPTPLARTILLPAIASTFHGSGREPKSFRRVNSSRSQHRIC